MSLLGIDVGTTGCKAAAYSLDGKCLGQAYREYPTLRSQPGWAELDSRQVWQEVMAVISEAAQATSRDPISAIGISSMGEAMTPVSADRRILGNAILSSDLRGAQYVDALKAGLSEEALYHINPNVPGPNYSFPKLRWIRENAPDLWERTDRFLLWSDLVAFMLGCPPVTGFSLANRTMLFSVKDEDWSDQLLKSGGIPREKLPQVEREGTVIGTVADSLAREVGLPQNVSVVVGAHDQCCNALGAGAVNPCDAVCGIGTYECITPVYDEVPDASDMLKVGLNVEHHAVPGLYVSFLYNQSGSLVRWFRDTFARGAGGAAISYDDLNAEMPEGPSGLMALPYFEMTGPPQFVQDASGVIAGLTLSTSRGRILKAIMEGVTFYFSENLDNLALLGICPQQFVATGGGARSDAWLQIKADVLGVPFLRPAITECACLGAAMLAGLGAGAFSNPEDAVSRYVRIVQTFDPDPKRHQQYGELQQKHQKLFPLMREYLSGLHSIVESP